MHLTYFCEPFFKKLGLDESEKGEDRQNLSGGREHILAW